jgi:glycosyltransferase involved in cell wall biosynthesis
MKVLIAAAACHPTSGSEAYVGWQAITQLRRDHDLWVLTSGWCREGIEAFLEKNPDWRNVQFFYVDKPLPDHPNRLVARMFSWIRYRRWCLLAAKVGAKLAVEVKFDLAQHVTLATWRTGSPLSGIGIPWIWGPIGGGEVFPWRIITVLSPVAAIFEVVRAVNTWFAKKSPSVRRAARDATLILPNNPETESLIVSLGVPKEKIRRLCQSFLPEERLGRLKRKASITPRECGELRCLAGGNLEGRKGVAIAIHALVQLKKEGLPFRYTYMGRGPELAHLKALADQLGIAERVNFVDSLSGDEYVQALQSSHVYLLPSLREGVPVTQIEAMAAGCVPLVANCGGAGPMAEAAGIAPITVCSFRKMSEDLYSRATELWQDPGLWETQSRASMEAISRLYTSKHYREEVAGIYRRVVKTASL